MKTILVVAACAAVLAGGANAATVEASSAPVTTTLAPASSISGNAGIYTNSISGNRLSPWYQSAQDNSPFYSIWSGGSITFTFSALQSALALAWGTPDSYNYVSFYNGSTLLETLSGSAIPANGADGLSFAQLVKITPVAAFDKAVFWSNGTAFEFAGLDATPSPVPVPAAGLMLTAALGGLTALRRRKRTA